MNEKHINYKIRQALSGLLGATRIKLKGDLHKTQNNMNKKIFLVLLSVITAGMFASCNKLFPSDADALPTPAHQFIDQHFPDNNIILIQRDGSVYDVKLSGNIELEFYSNGDWKEVDCNNNAVPSGIIPEEILNYVAQNYPDNFIVKISRNGQHYEIELNNGFEFDYNLNGNNGGGNDNGNGGNNGGGNGYTVTLPDAALQFISTNFPTATVAHIEKDGFEFDVVLSNGVEIEFDLNGNWIDIDCHNNAVPESIIPAGIYAYVVANYPNNFIVKIEHRHQRYEVELNNHIDLVFDNNENFLYID